MDAPDFINTSLPDIVKRVSANYESITGKPLQPGQADQLILNSGAYEVFLQAVRVQGAAVQNLAQFATYPALDALAQPFGVNRLGSKAAGCKAKATLITGHGNLLIPAKTRIQTQDGLATFLLEQDTVIPSTVDEVTVDLICESTGDVGNNYQPGKVNVILDPQPYLVSLENIDETGGGSESEADESLRSRLYDSLNAISTAGSTAAYRYHAKSASQLIIDVEIQGDTDTGHVHIYPLVASGSTPQEVLDAVYNACNAEEKRPLTDKVFVHSPGSMDYSIEAELVLYSSADITSTLAASIQGVKDLANANGSRLGMDAVIDQIKAAALIKDKVYKVNVKSPAADIEVDRTQVARCTGVNISVIGFNSDK